MENKFVSIEKYMSMTYITMLAGVLLSFLTSFISISVGLASLMITSKLIFMLFAGALLATPFIIKAKDKKGYLIQFLIFTVCFGILLSPVFTIFPVSLILTSALISIGLFAGVSAIGYFTKYDFSKWGTYLFYALFALIVVSIIMMFFTITKMAHIFITVIGILLFIGFILYDTWKAKKEYGMVVDNDSLWETVLRNATQFFLDFMNLFIRILALMGED